MNLRLIFSAACFSFALTVFSPAQTSSAPKGAALEQTLITREKALIEAKKKDDDEFFRGTLADNFTLVPVDGQLRAGEEALNELGDSDLKELTPYDVRVVALNSDAAIITYNAIFVEAPKEDEGPRPRYQHFSSIWVKQGTSWKLKFHQATAIHWGDW